MLDNFIIVDDVYVNKEIVENKFTCDLEVCKGACCTMESQFGAPTTMEEITKIEEILPQVLPYLTQKHQKAIEEGGFWEIKQNQELIKSINDRDCVFVYYDKDIAKCAIEKAYFEGKVSFRKPISCHLFPIRVGEFGGPVLRYERFHECECAEAKGKKTGIRVLDFCKDSLVRAFGEEWFEKVSQKSKDI